MDLILINKFNIKLSCIILFPSFLGDSGHVARIQEHFKSKICEHCVCPLNTVVAQVIPFIMSAFHRYPLSYFKCQSIMGLIMDAVGGN